MWPTRTDALRGLALFLGTFAVANVFFGAFAPGADGNVWWIDLRGLPAAGVASGLAATGALLVAWAWRPAAGPKRRAATRVALGAVAVAGACNAARAISLAAEARISMFPAPFSVFVVVAAVALEHAVRRPGASAGRAWPVAAAGGWAVAFALLQMLCFGGTDYARPADVIVVFGARAYADGTPSQSLADRVRTACALWHARRAPLLVLSGGPGDGAFHETDVMAELARADGVPESAILLDRGGVSTRATVEDATAMLRARGLSTALAVSHAYHLPRVRMAFDRAGFAVFTVPARETRAIAKTPLLVAREVLAMWDYWLTSSIRG